MPHANTGQQSTPNSEPGGIPKNRKPPNQSCGPLCILGSRVLGLHSAKKFQCSCPLFDFSRCCCLLISCVTGTNINLIPGCECVRTANPIPIPVLVLVPIAALPNAVSNCTVFNRTELSVDIQCVPGYDGGLPQIFVLEMFSTRTGITR